MVNFIAFFGYIIAVFGCCEMMIYFNGPFDIIDKWREFLRYRSEGLYNLFTCFACLSTWVGFVLSAIDLIIPEIAITPFNIIIGEPSLWWLVVPLDGFFACGTTWMLHQLEEYMEHHRVVVYKDGEKLVYEDADDDEEADAELEIKE